MTTPRNPSGHEEAALVLARVVTDLAGLLEAAYRVPQTEGHPLLDPGVVLEVSGVQSRPGRAGEPQRIALWCLQRGPLPATPLQFWATLKPEDNQPYEIGAQYDLLLRRRA
jgi:hypothetical protein